MPTIVPVRFKYASRDLWFDAGQTGIAEGDHAICSTERGREIGIVTQDPREVTDEELHELIGNATLKPVLRVATETDLALAEELAERGEEAFPIFRQLVSESGLDMKPVGVEYLLDGDKVVCYFAAEERVDFRALVRDLARELHVRVDMRQIGVREEAAMVGGWGHCGQELCCKRFGLAFEPVSIRMAKEQDLPLNSTKISGACGRLMCCLRYEFEAYRDFKTRAPKKNAVIETPLGVGKIVEYNTPKEEVAIRLENGKVIRIALADMVASEAAHKKSEELGCPCRPDTVTRDVLARLQSPDVQMALAELDRKNGIAPAETANTADIFVETKPRRRKSEPAKKDGEAEAAEAQAAPAAQGKRKRRRKRGSGAAAAEAAQPAASEITVRRRRHHKSDAEAGEAQAAEQTPTKRRRRPGDKGGVQAQAQQAQQAQQQAQQQAKAQQAKVQQQAKAQQAKVQQQAKDQAQEKAEGDAPAKRRRRRRRRGGSGNSAPTTE